MNLEIKDQNMENYTTVPLTDYVETMLQGYCDQCEEIIPQEHGLPVFWCPEHEEIKQAEKKCPDCQGPLKFNSGYYLIDGKVTQHRKPYLLCGGCSDELWLTFTQTGDLSIIEEENNDLIATLEGHKWVHSMRSTQLIQNIRKEKLVKISQRHLFKLSQTKIYLLEEYLQSKIGDIRQRTWYSKILADAIELGVKIETLHPLLCQQMGAYMSYLNWPIKNSVREIVEHNPTNFNDLISQKFETSSIAIRRILGGKSDYESGKRYKSPSINIYTFNQEFTQCNTVKNKIDDYVQKHEKFHKHLTNKCLAHCDEKEYKSRKTSSHQDFIIDIARENIKDLCDIYNDYVLDSIEVLNSIQNLDIKLPYKITFGSIVKLNYEAEQQLIKLLWDTDKQITQIKENLKSNNSVADPYFL